MLFLGWAAITGFSRFLASHFNIPDFLPFFRCCLKHRFSQHILASAFSCRLLSLHGTALELPCIVTPVYAPKRFEWSSVCLSVLYTFSASGAPGLICFMLSICLLPVPCTHSFPSIKTKIKLVPPWQPPLPSLAQVQAQMPR